MMFGNNQSQSLRNRNGLAAPSRESDFVAAAAEADQRRIQQFGYNPGQQQQMRGMAEPGGARSSSNNTSLQNININSTGGQTATSLNQAKTILSQVLTNISQDPAQNQSMTMLNN